MASPAAMAQLKKKWGARAEPRSVGARPGDTTAVPPVTVPPVVPARPMAPTTRAVGAAAQATGGGMTPTPGDPTPTLLEDEPEDESAVPAAARLAGFPGARNPLSEVGDAAPPAEAFEPVPIVNDPIAFAIQLISDLTYEGYNSAAVRAKLRANVTWGDALALLGVYSRVGNAADKRLGGKIKVRSAAVTARQLLSKCAIRPKASDSDSLTLPRVAQTLAPMLLALRKQALTQNLLEVRVATSSPLEYQDVAFNGLYDQAADYCVQFGRVLGRAALAGTNKDFDEKACDARNENFRTIAKNGLLRDEDLRRGLALTDFEDLYDWYTGGSGP